MGFFESVLVAVAWAEIVLGLVGVLLRPWLIGRPRDPVGPGEVVAAMLLYPFGVLLAGRVLGWW